MLRIFGVPPTSRWPSKFFVAGVLGSFFGSPFVRAAETAESPTSSALLLVEDAIVASTRTIRSGYRYESHAVGTLAVSREAFPEGGQARFAEVSPLLGGGFLFAVGVSAGGGVRTALYRASTFTGPLEPIALVPLSNVELVGQRSRVLLRTEGDLFEFELREPRLRPVSFGERVVEPSRVRFVGTRGLAIEAPLFGVLFSEDEGTSFRSLEGVLGLGAAGSGTVETALGPRILGESGELRSLESLRERPPKAEVFGGLEALLERGVRRGDALVALTEFGRLEAERGPHLSLRLDPRERRTGCRGFEGRVPHDKARFVCWARDGVTLVEEGGRVLVSLSGERRSLGEGRGGFVASGGCDGKEGFACAVLEDERGGFRRAPLDASEPREVLGVVDGEAWGVRSAAGRVVLRRRTGKALVVEVEWPREKELAEWFELFAALRQLHGDPERGIGFVLTRGDEFVGVRARLGDKVLEIGPVKRGLQRLAIHGDALFLWGASGYVQRSLDGGLTYDDVLLPHASGDGDPSAPRESRSPSRFGCSDVGCIFGRTLVLWPRERIPSERVALPERTLPLPATGRARWSFRCGLLEGAPAKPKDAEFWGRPRPSTSPSITRIVARSVDEFGQLSVEGPTNLSFRTTGLTRLLYREPFSAEVREARPTRGLFPDATEAEQALGLLDRSAGNAYLLTTADGRSGIFSSQVRERVTAFAFDEGGPLTPLFGLVRGVVGGRFSVARSEASLVLGEHTGSEFVLSELGQGRLTPLARYPTFGGRYRRIEVASDEASRLAVSLQHDTGLFVHPMLADRSLGAPFVVSLAEKLEACPADATGYLIVAEPSLAPDLSSEEGPLLLLRPTVRVRVGPGGACLDGLAARARGGFVLPRERVSESGASILVVSDFGEERVTRLACR